MVDEKEQIRDVLVSVVSHGHAQWLPNLLSDLAAEGNRERIIVILTHNIPETLALDFSKLPYPLYRIHNPTPKGFSQNHNKALFKMSAELQITKYCVLNPDVRMAPGTISALANRLEKPPAPGVVAPLAVSPEGHVEDNLRPWPTPLGFLRKMAGWSLGRRSRPLKLSLSPDWASGLLLMFSREAFLSVQGFDERYYMYYEDVDICCRLQLAGHRFVPMTQVRVIHDAQRRSHRSFKYAMWHLASAFRFFTSSSSRACRQAAHRRRT